jgi:hypothetical protein
MSSNAADINLSRKAIINYRVDRGDSFAPPPVSFEIDGSPENFSGCTLKMQVVTDGKRVMKELTNGAGINVSSNILQYSISATDMAEFPAGIYRYDVQKTDGSGIVSTIQSGTIKLAEDVTT